MWGKKKTKLSNLSNCWLKYPLGAIGGLQPFCFYFFSYFHHTENKIFRERQTEAVPTTKLSLVIDITTEDKLSKQNTLYCGGLSFESIFQLKHLSGNNYQSALVGTVQSTQMEGELKTGLAGLH